MSTNDTITIVYELQTSTGDWTEVAVAVAYDRRLPKGELAQLLEKIGLADTGERRRPWHEQIGPSERN